MHENFPSIECNVTKKNIIQNTQFDNRDHKIFYFEYLNILKIIATILKCNNSIIEIMLFDRAISLSQSLMNNNAFIS